MTITSDAYADVVAVGGSRWMVREWSGDTYTGREERHLEGALEEK